MKLSRKWMRSIIVTLMIGCLTIFSGVFLQSYKMVKAEKVTNAVEDEKALTTKIYYKNSNNWEKVNVWAWTMEDTSQLVKDGWPGDEMTSYDEEWFVFELESEKTFGILFNNGEEQTADNTEIVSGKTYWFVPNEEKAESENGIGGGIRVMVYDTPLEGFPEATNQEGEMTEETQPTEVLETEETETTEETKPTQAPETEETETTEETSPTQVLETEETETIDETQPTEALETEDSKTKEKDSSDNGQWIVWIVVAILILVGGIGYKVKSEKK